MLYFSNGDLCILIIPCFSKFSQNTTPNLPSWDTGFPGTQSIPSSEGPVNHPRILGETIKKLRLGQGFSAWHCSYVSPCYWAHSFPATPSVTGKLTAQIASWRTGNSHGPDWSPKKFSLVMTLTRTNPKYDTKRDLHHCQRLLQERIAPNRGCPEKAGNNGQRKKGLKCWQISFFPCHTHPFSPMLHKKRVGNLGNVADYLDLPFHSPCNRFAVFGTKHEAMGKASAGKDAEGITDPAEREAWKALETVSEVRTAGRIRAPGNPNQKN